VENLINMVIPQAEVEGFEPRPVPADWTDLPPGQRPENLPPAAPVVNRFERRYGATPGGSSQPVTLQAPPRTIGSKIPINRRHKRRR
jgi:hypothetical protein